MVLIDFTLNEKSEIAKFNKPILMDPKLSDRLMEHQKEAVKFLWKNTMAGVIAYQERLLKDEERRRKEEAGEDVELSQESNGGAAKECTDESSKATGDIREIFSKQAKSGGSAASSSKASQKALDKAATGNGCVIAHCMGSGKSLTTVSFVVTLLTDPYLKSIRNPNHLSLPLIHKVLIIAPVNVISNWSLEFGKWTPPSLMRLFNRYVIDASKKPTERYSELVKWNNTGGVLITGKELFCQLISSADKDIAAEADLLASETSSVASTSAASCSSAGAPSEAMTAPSAFATLVPYSSTSSVHTSQRASVVKRAKMARNVKKILLDPGACVVPCTTHIYTSCTPHFIAYAFSYTLHAFVLMYCYSNLYSQVQMSSY
jgi:hypothetical protein